MRTNFFGNLANLWRLLTTGQKAALTIAIMILGMLVVVAVHIASPPNFAPLYGNLGDEDAAIVVDKLKEQKIDYRVNQRGTIEVPENKVGELRMMLAGQGIPHGDGVGFELFDRAQLGQSEFGERLNYVRALQTELGRTIGQLESVRTVRVHLVIPQRRLFENNEHVASASVVLALKRGQPNSREIKSIIHLVSTAVEGLQPENVTVVDTTGNLLSDVVSADGSGGADSRLQEQHTEETKQEARLQSMLDRVLGPNKSLVRVSLKMNYDRRKSEREIYTPQGNTPDRNIGVLESQHTTTENYGGKSPNALSMLSSAMSNASATNGSGYVHYDSVSQYRISKQIEHTDYAAGQVNQVSVALFLDESVKQEQAAGLQDTIAAAAGAKRDDVRVQTMAFDTTAVKAAEAEVKKEERSELWGNLTRIGGAVVLIFVFLFLLFIMYRNVANSTMDATLLPEAPGGPALTAIPDRAVSQYHAMSPALPGGMEDGGNELVAPQLDPRRVAQVIQSMLAEEE